MNLGMNGKTRCDRVFRPDRWSEGFRWLMEHGFVPCAWMDDDCDRPNSFVHRLKAPGRATRVYVARYGDNWLAAFRTWTEEKGYRTSGISGDYSGKTPEEALEKLLDASGLEAIYKKEDGNE